MFTALPDPASDRCALLITLDILSRFPRDPPVAILLRVNSIRQNVDQRGGIVSATKTYIQVIEPHLIILNFSPPLFNIPTSRLSPLSTPHSLLTGLQPERGS